jgi:pimeloyl-ACP methyl ester carboxylesterase
MQDRLEPFGGAGPQLVFAHANGYPPGSYRRFIEPLLQHCRVTAFRHRPLWCERVPARRLSWSHFADDLIHTLESCLEAPVWMMGHSLGGAVAMIAAAKSPHLFRGLLLIDPVFVAARQALLLRLLPRVRVRQQPMVRAALRRPDRFPDQQAAFDFHRARRPCAGIADEVLWDYIRAGTTPEGEGGLRLAFPREWEAGIYASVPWIWPAVRRVRLPTLGLRGESSEVLTPAALHRWGVLQPEAELHTCPGGHLLPLERPESTARYVIDFIERRHS